MKLPTLALVCLLSWATASARGAEPVLVHLSDPEQVLSSEQSWRTRTDEKLASFEEATGLRILLVFRAKSPPAEEDKVPGAFMHALATKLGLEKRGVLAVYFAEDDEWRLWLGDETAATFVGTPGTAAELTKSGAIHRTKEAFLAEVTTAGDTAYAKRKQDSPAWRRQLRTDAMVDGLIRKFRQK